MNKSESKKNKIRSNKRNKLLKIFTFLLLGIMIFSWGLLDLLFLEPRVYIASGGRHPFQLVVSNGFLQIIIGLGFIIEGLITLKNRNKIEKPENKVKRKNWLKHY